MQNGVLTGTVVFLVICFAVFAGMMNLVIFHYRIMYIGITTVAYLESRHARGPLLWQMNRKEYRASLKLSLEMV